MGPCVGKEGTNVSLRLAFAIFYGKNTSDYPPRPILSEDNLIFGCL